jgi:PST family polysaccharide transporter
MLRNLLSLTGGELVGKLLTFAVFAYLARLVGPQAFGFVEFAGAALLCAGLLVDQGFGPYGAREIARMPQSTGELVAEIVGVRCILAVAAYLIVLALALALDRPPVVRDLLLLYGLSLFAMPFLLQWVFQGHDRMAVIAVAQIIRQAVFAAIVFAFVRGASQLWLVAIGEIAGTCAAAAYTIQAYRLRLGGALRLHLRPSVRLFREGVPIGLSQIFWLARTFGAILIVGLVASAEDVGFFAGAQRIQIALHTFVWLYFFNLLPTFARAWQQSEAAFRRVVDLSFHMVAWLAAAGIVVWVGLAPAMMAGVYGSAFAPAGSTLQWLAPVCVLAALSGHYRFGLIAAGRQNAEMFTSMLGAAAGVVAIPAGYRLGGPSGAAMGLCLAEATVWVSSWAYGRRLLGLRSHGRILALPLGAATAAAAVVWLVPLESLMLRLALATALTVALALFADRVVLAQVSTAARQVAGFGWR